MQKYPPLPVWNFSPVWIPEANEHLPSPSHTSPKAAGMGGGSPSILVSCLLPPPTPPEVIAVEWLRGRKGKASWLPVFKTLYLLHESLGPPAILAIHSFISLFFSQVFYNLLFTDQYPLMTCPLQHLQEHLPISALRTAI